MSDSHAHTTDPTDVSEPTAPDDFGLVQVFWGDEKGNTTAVLGALRTPATAFASTCSSS